LLRLNRVLFAAGLVTWGWATRRSCETLEKRAQREACVFGITNVMSRDLVKTARPKFQSHGAKNIESYMRDVIGNSAAEMCATAKKDVRRACIYGWLRYSIYGLGEEAPQVICDALQEHKENRMGFSTCIEICHKYIENADAVIMHFLIVKP